MLNIHEKAFVKDQRDVFFLLRGDPYLGALLNDTILRGDRNQDLMRSLKVRADLLNVTLSFWTLVVSDMPWYLNEDGGLDIRNTGAGLAVPERHAQEQVLCKNALYENVAIMRDAFRCFHNRDGTYNNQLRKHPQTYINRVSPYSLSNGWFVSYRKRSQEASI